MKNNQFTAFLKKNFWLVLSIIYIVSPIDFIPEFLAPILGPLIIVDDLGVLLVALAQKYMAHRSEMRRVAEKENLIEGQEA